MPLNYHIIPLNGYFVPLNGYFIPLNGHFRLVNYFCQFLCLLVVLIGYFIIIVIPKIRFMFKLMI
jgi:hypothetical protein